MLKVKAGCNESLCQNLASTYFLLQDKTWTGIMHFFLPLTLNLLNGLSQNHDRLSGHKQSMCEVKTPNVSK